MYKVVSVVPKKRIERFGVIPPSEFEIKYLNSPYSTEELIKACEGADFLFESSVDPVPREAIESFSSIKLIQAEGVGYDKIDIEAAREKNIYVCNNRNVNCESVAEHTLGLILAALRRIPYADKEIKDGNFVDCQLEYRTKGYKELGSRHIGIVGLGAIGKETVKRLLAFNCKISYYDAYRLTKEEEKQLNINYLSFEEICSQCHIISFHVPVLPSTINMVNKDSIANMKKDAIIINTARGEIVNQEDLARALMEDRLGGAALDTLTPEPPDKDHPLLNLPPKAASKLIITPHIGGTTDEAFERMQKWAWENMLKVTRGERPNNIVNGL
ncbi:MAG: glycerate dehydrogenase [Tissierellia bacterium]|nr:glycerate dehydrogenase [Tissierellia bacterium]